MTQEPHVGEVRESGSDDSWLQYLEWAFYLVLLAGVAFIAYQVVQNKWQLLERRTDEAAS